VDQVPRETNGPHLAPTAASTDVLAEPAVLLKAEFARRK
jgi:hypothetical protein